MVEDETDRLNRYELQLQEEVQNCGEHSEQLPWRDWLSVGEEPDRHD